MANIERDERRWTIEGHDDDYLGYDSATFLDGPDVTERVEVVPASQLAAAVEALANLRQVAINGGAIKEGGGYDVTVLRPILGGQ